MMPDTETFATPGAVVASGALVTPGGPVGPQGPAGTSAVSTDAGNTATLGSDAKIFVPAPTPAIWSARLRSFNTIGNPNFAVAQRNCRGALVNPSGGVFIEDRWATGNLGSLNPTFQTLDTAFTPGSGVVVPGTSFVITTSYLRITVGTQKVSLAAGDACYLTQYVEGPLLRELMGDVHSLSILCRSSAANLKFGIGITDPGNTRTLTKLCTLGAANTITLITLPSLPNFSGGNFSCALGNFGYAIRICVASGSTYMAPANDTFQNGNFLSAVGQDNLMAQAAGSTFEIFFIQHEPGGVCSTLIDKPFNQSLDECLRYFEKSHSYASQPGVGGFGSIVINVPASGVHPVTAIRFKKVMAKTPTIVGYSASSRAPNTVRDTTAGADRAITAAYNSNDAGFNGFTVTGGVSTMWVAALDYTADTGW